MQEPDQPDRVTDDPGVPPVKFIATVQLADGGFLTRETTNRLDVLQWFRLHTVGTEHDVALTIEATGEAAWMLMTTLALEEVSLLRQRVRASMDDVAAELHALETMLRKRERAKEQHACEKE